MKKLELAYVEGMPRGNFGARTKTAANIEAWPWICSRSPFYWINKGCYQACMGCFGDGYWGEMEITFKDPWCDSVNLWSTVKPPSKMP